MGALIRSYDWDSHPLGPPEKWPESLKTNIRLILNSDFPMFIWWSKDLYMFHNDAYLPALGKKHPEALGASARAMWAEIWDQIGGIAENILANGEAFYAKELMMFLERKGFAEETYWTFSYSPAFNDAGEVEGMFCACNEETSSVLSQRRLKTLKDISSALAQVQSMDQLGNTACQVLNENQNDLPFNLIYFCNSVGSEAVLMGQSGFMARALAPQRINLASTEGIWPFAAILQSHESLIVDLPQQPSDAAVKYTATRAAVIPVFKPGEDVVIGFYVSGISNKQEYDESYKGFHNLLARQIATSFANVQARLEILERQEYLKDIFQQAPVGITMLRGRNYIVDIANPGVCEIWRVQQEDVLGRPILEVIPEAIDQGFKALLDEVMETGKPYVANELPLVLERDGVQETIYLNFVYHPLRNEQGFVTGIIVVAIDISEQVNARQEIESINQELLVTNADLDNFVYSASHDLKAPIHNIEGLVNELLEYLTPEVASSSEVQQLTSYIKGSINRFKKVVTDLTEVTKIQRATGEDVDSINLEEVIEEILLDFKPAIATSGAVINVQLAPAATIYFSAKHIRSILYNLLGNSLKYSSPERTPQITITTSDTPDYTILTVADNGLGIKPGDISKVFTMFKRLHDHVEGSGIGLYIVKKIVENAGGKIEVESELNKGTTFRVYLKK